MNCLVRVSFQRHKIGDELPDEDFQIPDLESAKAHQNDPIWVVNQETMFPEKRHPWILDEECISFDVDTSIGVGYGDYFNNAIECDLKALGLTDIFEDDDHEWKTIADRDFPGQEHGSFMLLYEHESWGEGEHYETCVTLIGRIDWAHLLERLPEFLVEVKQ